MEEFYGKTYIHNDKRIGVILGMGGTWICGHITDTGRHKRFVSPSIPVSEDPAVVQLALDEYARGRALIS